MPCPILVPADPDGPIRLDLELVRRGLVRSRSHARDLIDRGSVRVGDVVADRASSLVTAGTTIDVDPDPYVSRAARKLVGAIDDLAPYDVVPVEPGWRALDAGASTGGFTQVLLERGAGRVYAVDVGHDQLDPTLRADPRVVNRERFTLRELTLAVVEDRPVDLVVADVSFISLTLLVEPLLAVLAPSAPALLMVKPQFEVGRHRLGKNGLVRSETDRAAAVTAVIDTAERLDRQHVATVPSRVPGPAGNVEFFVLLR